MKTAQVWALFIALFFTSFAYSQEVDSTDIWIEQIESSLNYQEGTIKLPTCNVTIVVPKGYGFLDKEQSQYVLTELWGNPEDNEVLGMMVKRKYGVLDPHSFAFTINYQDIGYVEDGDAKKIDYTDMLKELKTETREGNALRKELGYGAIQLIGWASKPYYDSEKKVLHWAKELKFEDEDINTLNYNLRVLGRHGVLFVNAVANMNDLAIVKPDVNEIIENISFDEGSRYEDFNSATDNVAAWTLGSLVAGKVLAKAGFFALIAKFGKFIAIAVGGIFLTLWKKFRGRKEEEQVTQENTPLSNRTNDPEKVAQNNIDEKLTNEEVITDTDFEETKSEE